MALIANKKIVTTSEFSVDGNGLSFSDNAGFAKAAFDLIKDDISDVKQFGDSYYLTKIIKRVEPVVLAIDLVRERIFNELKVKLQKEKAKEQAQIYLTKAISSKDIEKLSKENSLKFKSTKLFIRNENIPEIGDSTEFIKASFSLNKEQSVYPEMVENSLGYFVIQFKEKKLPEESEILENMESLQEQLLRNKQTQSYQTWIAQLREQNKITYNTQFLK